MKDFIDIKDVEVNNMKKRELLEANGGYVDPIIIPPITSSGLIAPTPSPEFPFPWD
ncbi:MAG: hypothetical protein K9G70_13220 [Prolixibacteraceae bacterium]|nr:hypothetical protein [Prolixibacteraceae bacterium]